jgi:hypothetical protein
MLIAQQQQRLSSLSLGQNNQQLAEFEQLCTILYGNDPTKTAE